MNARVAGMVAPALAGLAAMVVPAHAVERAAAARPRPREGQATAQQRELEAAFTETIRPFLDGHCAKCHGSEKPKGQVDLSGYDGVASVVRDHETWAIVEEKISAREMPPEDAKQPSAEARAKVLAWIQGVRKHEARRHAGDPGVVLARRLSNAEYNYTIRDLTGVDIRPTREFPVDPANPAGFDNSGESLVMSPALMKKYLMAAREVANHLVMSPNGLAFAPHPVLVETDRDKYVVQRIVDFYKRQPTDYADYFRAAWRYKHRARLGRGRLTLDAVAAESRVSPRYLSTVWKTLEDGKDEVGPLARLRGMWRALPAPAPGAGEAVAAATRGDPFVKMRDYVVALRKKIEPRFTSPAAEGIRANSQPSIMWRNRQYASHRLSYDREALQIEGAPVVEAAAPAPVAKPAPGSPDRGRPQQAAARAAVEDEDEDEDEDAKGRPRRGPDPELRVPAGARAKYEAAFARFAAVFPDAFYVAERGRNYLDRTRDKGRYLSAGFHNLMGYFRDDQPLGQLILDEAGRKELDGMWRELDFVAAATARTFTQFYLSESGQAREAARQAFAGAGASNPTAAGPGAAAAITSEANIKKVADVYLGRARSSGNKVAVAAVEEHFAAVNASIRWAERARVEAEPRHLEAMLKLAARAYRRPLTREESEGMRAQYKSLRSQSGLDHEEAMRDVLVNVLMSPDFCYRIDLVEAAAGRREATARPLSAHALASRLSYFLWSSMPDAELLARAASGELRKPAVLVAQARRMLRDDRARGLVTEFGGHWLDFRRFEEHNAVDRQRFPTFDSELRRSMFEEPLRFIADVVRNDRSVLDLLYGGHTFVNAALARHYAMGDDVVASAGAGEWVRVEDARKFGRGGLLPMSVFLTMNAPGLRTSPVKRGYWVARRVLGEQIPPPPAVVPELPRDEAQTDLPLRQLLAKHREDPSCAGCHARFDSFGVAFEGYGPVGERRTKDLAGRAVDARAAFPGGSEGADLTGLLDYIRSNRQGDFLDNLCRKLLAYALGRSLVLSDEPTIEAMRARLSAGGQRFGVLVESIVTSPQFLNKRGADIVAGKVN
jgi:mono/diheme cytochrome c family protein